MTKRVMALVFLLAFVAAEAQAQVKAVITGPKEANAGDLIILDASQSSNAVEMKWVLIGSNKTYLPVDNNMRCVFATGQSGSYTFALAVAGQDNNGKLDIDIALHAIQIGNPTPPIPPDDNVEVPADEFDNVGRLSFQRARQLPAEARAKIIPTAALYRDVAKRIKDGSLVSINAATAEIQTKRLEIWASTASAWQTTWLTPITATWNKFWENDTLKSRFAIARFYEAQAAGLEAAGR